MFANYPLILFENVLYPIYKQTKMNSHMCKDRDVHNNNKKCVIGVSRKTNSSHTVKFLQLVFVI